MFDKIFSSTTALEKGLDITALKARVIQNNIANAETPGFKSSSVDFNSALKSALNGESGLKTKTTRPGHMVFSSSSDLMGSAVHTNQNTSMRMDGNNVDIDYENAEMAKNNIYYSALVEKLNSEFRRLRMAIREGG